MLVAVKLTNNYEKKTFSKIINLLLKNHPEKEYVN